MTMFSSHWRNTRFRFIALLAVAMTGMAACGLYGTDVAQWTEEVKLHDGTMIVIERHATRGKSSFPNPGRGPLGIAELWYRPMNIHYKGGGGGYILSFEIVDGTAYMANMGWGCNMNGPNGYKLRFFRWDGKKWLQIPQNEFPLQLATVNVSTDYWGYTSRDDQSGFLSWDAKVKRSRWDQNYGEPLEQWAQRYRHLYICNNQQS